MIDIKPGSVYTAHHVASGNSDKGQWELIAIREESKGKSKKSITIWPATIPSGVATGGSFVVDRITRVKYSAKKSRDGQWYDDVSVYCDIHHAAVAEAPKPRPNTVDDDLPF